MYINTQEMKQNDYFGLTQTSKPSNSKPTFLNPFLQQNPSPKAAFHISQNLKTGLVDRQATKSLEQTFISLPNQQSETSSKISIKSPSISQSLTRTSKFFFALEMQFSQRGQQDCSQLMKDLQFEHENKRNKMNSSFVFPSNTNNSIFDTSLAQQERLNKTQILNSNQLQNDNQIEYGFKKNRREDIPLDILRKDEQNNAQLSNLIKQSNIQLYPQLENLDLRNKNQNSQDMKNGSFKQNFAKKDHLDMYESKLLEEQGTGKKIQKQDSIQDKKIEAKIDSVNNLCQNKQAQSLYLSVVSDNLSSFADESTIKKNPRMEQSKQQIDERSFARQQIYSLILDGSLIQHYKDSSSEDEFSSEEQDDNQSEDHKNNIGTMKKQNKTYFEVTNKQSEKLYPKLAQRQLQVQKLPKVEQIEDKVEEEWESEAEDQDSVINEQQQEDEGDEREVQQDDENDEDGDDEDEDEDEKEGKTKSLVQLKSQLIGMYLWNRMSAPQIEKMKETIIMYYKSTTKFPSKPRNTILSLLENLVMEIERLEKVQFKECEVRYKKQLNMFVEKQKCKKLIFQQHYQQELGKLGREVIKHLEKNEEKRKQIVRIAKKYNNREYFHVKQRRIIFAEIQHLIKLIVSCRKTIERAIKLSGQVESSSSDEPVHQANNFVSSPTTNLVVPTNISLNQNNNRVNQNNEYSGQNNVQLGNSQPTQMLVQAPSIIRPVVNVINDIRPHNNISVVNQAQFSLPLFREDLQTEASSNLLQSRISIPESGSQQNPIQNSIISYSLSDLKSYEAGKYLLSILEKNKIQNLQNIMSQYNSSNYFHVGPRRSILYFIQQFANKMNCIENTLFFPPVAKSATADKLIKAGNELRQYFTSGKVQQVNGTARNYNPSNYFHVGPRYSIFGDVRKVIQVYSRTI